MLKKVSLWYGIFTIALILNQTEAFKTDIKVTLGTYGLWIILLILTCILYKEGEWGN